MSVLVTQAAIGWRGSRRCAATKAGCEGISGQNCVYAVVECTVTIGVKNNALVAIIALCADADRSADIRAFPLFIF